MLWWLQVGLCLRANEIWFLRPDLFYCIKGLRNQWYLEFPKWAMGNGVKSGKVRRVPEYVEPLLNLYLALPTNIVHLVNARNFKVFLTDLGCSAAAARHMGAHYFLVHQDSLPLLRETLGHTSMISSKFYIDFWQPEVSYAAMRSAIIKCAATLQ